MKALVIYCHPNPASFCAAARDRVVAALERSGHDVRVTDLYADGFSPEFTAWDRQHHLLPDHAPELERHMTDLLWAEAILFVYPTWWSGQPAMLKGWVDRVWACGVAWEFPDEADRPQPLLSNIRRIAIVTMHGSSKLVNMLEGESGKRTIFRAIRLMCKGRIRTKWIAIYGLDTADEAKRIAWLDRVEREIGKL